MQTQNTTHLGDGVYVGHDGYQLWLGANHHLNMTVALDSSAFPVLVRYAELTLGWRVGTQSDAANLTYHLQEIKNCADEYRAMPTTSLLSRLLEAIERSSAAQGSRG